jgi:hypothetical protein
MTNQVKPALTPPIPASLTEPTIRAYFETLNVQNFQATADLFAAEGELLPPFESAIVGRDAILAYLETEAPGMTLLPQEMQSVASEPDDTSSDWISVVGKVQTALFTVNVRWQFLLNSASEILSVKIKLLASLQDLLHLKR